MHIMNQLLSQKKYIDFGLQFLKCCMDWDVDFSQFEGMDKMAWPQLSDDEQSTIGYTNLMLLYNILATI